MHNATEISSHITEFSLIAVLLVTTTLKLNILCMRPRSFLMLNVFIIISCLVVMVFLAHHE